MESKAFSDTHTGKISDKHLASRFELSLEGSLFLQLFVDFFSLQQYRSMMNLSEADTKFQLRSSDLDIFAEESRRSR